ncbi:hypothetical protein [Blastococcus jejuensis]|uniref:hypothetical protein n=1 Tax=Blastococcus jejuensis TaxID=351224 RepID=UPI0031D1C96C
MYVFVQLAERPDFRGEPPEHEPFVDSLVERQLVLLGGSLGSDAAAYVLRCDSLAAARAVVAEDPLVSSGAMTATVTAWDLVGVDLRLVEPDLVVGS